MFRKKWSSFFSSLKVRFGVENGVSYQWPAKWLPIINIRLRANNGKGPKVAIGLIAIGDIAIGVISGGSMAYGAIAVGGIAFGAAVLGGVGHGWLLGLGAVAVSKTIGVGILSVSISGFGAGIMAISHSAVGLIAIGQTAHGILAVGVHGWGLISFNADAISALKRAFD